jgi:hypothetical protein
MQQCENNSIDGDQNLWVKCNVDASFYDRDRTGALGVVLRDHDGRTCGVTAKWYEHSMNALTTEARACLDGICMCREGESAG